MLKTLAKYALLAAVGIAALGGLAGQDPAGAPVNRTGLVPLTDEEFAEISRTWPRVTRVHLNWLGLERVNAVRERAGKTRLDPASARPVGREFDSAVGERVAAQDLGAPAELAADLPVNVDNSTLKYFPPVRSQNPLGSCAAFSTTYYQLSYMTAFQRDLDIRSTTDNTNKYSPKWTYNMVNGGEDAGAAFSWIYPLLEKHGAATWAEFPYNADFKAWCLVPSVWRNALSVRSNPAQYISRASTDAGRNYIRELLNNGYVLVFGTYITSWQYKLLGDDPATPDDDAFAGDRIGYWLNGNEGAHAMTVVGYNDAVWTDINGNGTVDAGEKGAFRIANSWGPYWEDAGFIWLAYDALRSLSAVSGGPSAGRVQAFQSNVAWVLTARDNYSPLMIAEFTLSHLKRNQLKLTLGRSNVVTTPPPTVWTPDVVQNDGGAFAFDGSTTAVDGGFALDYSDILAEGAGPQRYHLGVGDNLAADPATLKAFKIVDLTTDPATETVYAGVPQNVDNQTVYFFVEYTYNGPAYDHPPVLSSPQVDPALGTTADTFTYYIHYDDQDGDSPASSDVYIDGAAHAMTLVSGSASDGWYGYTTTLPVGAHTYYFSFRDSRGATVRNPLGTATLAGPDVYAFLLSGLSPSAAAVGGPGFTLTVNGSNMAAGAVVTWDGGDRPTTFVSSSQVTAAIAAADLAAAKVVQVAVRNPDGGVSSPLSFTAANPVPALTSLAPGYAAGGGSAFTLNLTGTEFVPGSVVRWNGVARTTTYVGATALQAAIGSADIVTSGEAFVSVHNPEPGGGSSAALPFPVAGFTVSSETASATVDAGQSATYTIRVAADLAPFDSPVTLSCPSLPRGVSATFSPASVTPGTVSQTAQLTLRTTARTSSAAGAAGATPAGGGPFWPAALLAGLAALLALAATLMPAPRRSVRRWAAAAAVLSLVLFMSACSAKEGGGSNNTGTPAGTHQIGVRGSSGGLMSSVLIELVVR